MRLFIAMNFPAPLRRSIAAIGSDLERSGVPARWVESSAVHLTLKFLGEIPSGRVGGVSSALDDIAGGAEPVLLRFEGIGAFPSPRRPGVIWVGIESGPRLRLLHDALDRRMAEFGVARETRPFRPHITLGRVDRDSGPGEFREFEKRTQTLRLDTEIEIGQIDLMESRLRPGGPEYRLLHGAKLGTH
jgi:2'-5' RNA ligase